MKNEKKSQQYPFITSKKYHFRETSPNNMEMERITEKKIGNKTRTSKRFDFISNFIL